MSSFETPYAILTGEALLKGDNHYLCFIRHNYLNSHYAALRGARTSFTHCALTSKLSIFHPAFDHARALTWLPSFSRSHQRRSSYADDGNLLFNMPSICSKRSVTSLWLSGRLRRYFSSGVYLPARPSWTAVSPGF